MCIKFQSSCLSDVNMLLSEVSALMSEINVKMSNCRVQSKLLLPRVSTILSEMEYIVKLSQSVENVVDDVHADEESLGDGSWDYNYDYHNNYYDLNNLSFSSIGFCEDDVHVNVVEGQDNHDDVVGDKLHNACGLENDESRDASDSAEQCVIDAPGCDDTSAMGSFKYYVIHF